MGGVVLGANGHIRSSGALLSRICWSHGSKSQHGNHQGGRQSQCGHNKSVHDALYHFISNNNALMRPYFCNTPDRAQPRSAARPLLALLL